MRVYNQIADTDIMIKARESEVSTQVKGKEALQSSNLS